MNIRLQWYFWGGIRILNLDDAVADQSQGFGTAWPSSAPATRHLVTVLVKTETWCPQLSLWLTRSPSLSPFAPSRCLACHGR